MNTNWMTGSVWACVGGLLALALLQSWTSRMNQFFFFSRTVPIGFGGSAEAREIVRRYVTTVWLGFAVAAGMFAALMAESKLSVYLCFVSGLVAQGVVTSVGFARANRQTAEVVAAGVGELAVRAEQAVAVELLGATTISRNVVWLMIAAPLLSALAVMGVVHQVHTGLQGFEDAITANKADFLLGLGLGLETGGILLWVQLRYFSRHRSAMGRFTVESAVQLVWLGALAVVLSVMTVPMHVVVTTKMRAALMGVVLTVTLVRMLYGYARAKMFVPPAADRHGDECWRWGMFYYNPSDPTLFIQHRCGPGYTVNFAHWMSWVLALGLLADFVFLLSRHVLR